MDPTAWFSALPPVLAQSSEQVATGGGLLFLAFIGLAVVIGIATTVFWIWMLIEAATKEPSEGNDKLIWILLIVFLGFLGAILYFFIRRPQRITQHGS